MGIFDNFLDTLRLNDDDYDDGYDDYEDDYDDYEEEKVKNTKRFGKKKQALREDEDYEEEEDTGFSKTYSSRFNEETAAFKPKAKPQPISRGNSKLVPLNSAKGNKVFVIKPIEDSECWSIIDFLKEGKVIIINLEGMNVDDAQHIIDIIVGCCYTIEGDIKRISPSIFIAAPNNTEVSGDLLQGAMTGEGVTLDLRNNF